MDTVSGIGVLDKIMAILRIASEGPVPLRDLVARTQISRATAHRLAQGMESVGLLRRDDDGAYTLGLALIGLGRAAADAYPLTVVALPVLRRLRDETGESAQLFVADEGERLCVATVDSTHELRTIVPVGSRLPLHVGAAGRVLSGVAERDGWLASVAERAPGVASVAAPVRDGHRVVAAVSVSGPVERVSKRPGQQFGELVTAAACDIEAAMVGSERGGR
jgi:DNA-binding IclR family transcriptional regulator